MQEIEPEKLWIGHAADLRNAAGLYALGISAVVDLAYEEKGAVLSRDLSYCRFPLRDGGENSEVMLATAVEVVVTFLRKGIPTLIGCSAGMSRSPSIAAVAIALVNEQQPAEVLAHIGQLKPIDVSPGLWEQAIAVYESVQNKDNSQLND